MISRKLVSTSKGEGQQVKLTTGYFKRPSAHRTRICLHSPAACCSSPDHAVSRARQKLISCCWVGVNVSEGSSPCFAARETLWMTSGRRQRDGETEDSSARRHASESVVSCSRTFWLDIYATTTSWSISHLCAQCQSF